MKKIITCIAIAVMLFACSKEETPVSSDQESYPDSALKKGVLTVTTTYYAPDITYTTATAGGEVSKSGGGKKVKERGVCYSTSPAPTTEDSKVVSGSGPGSFTCYLTGLTPSTVYYIRAYAVKKSRTIYGNEISFSTLIPPVYGTVTDYDGNEYVTITMGTQTWMMENLKTTHYSNGDEIPNVKIDSVWRNLNTANEKGAWCDFKNRAANGATYGHMYNWYAVTDSRNLAPTGWHVPTKEDWETLQAYLGGDNSRANWIPVIGRKLKEEGIEHWRDPNVADNVSGFTALPGGIRSEDGTFGFRKKAGVFWTSSLYGPYAYYRSMYHKSGTIEYAVTGRTLDYYKLRGYYVRCVKD
ncbi:MAG: hypothetical protein GXO86_07500 [Chlorobi bacterium]|nr:hypothetical protein [Chlorobiota bacterium]